MPIRVPRLHSNEGAELPLRPYEARSHGGETNDLLPSRVMGYRHLPKLREALKRELKIETRAPTASKRNFA